VWIDLCAPPHLQTLWICFFYLTEDLGMAVGYGLCSVFASLNISWKIGFYIQGVMMIVVAAMFYIVPTEFYSNEHDASVELHEEVVRKMTISLS
jgi:hypothetical protein